MRNVNMVRTARKQGTQDANSSLLWKSCAKKKVTRLFATTCFDRFCDSRYAFVWREQIISLETGTTKRCWLLSSLSSSVVVVACRSCDERHIDKFCSRICHWWSPWCGFSLVFGKTFASGTNNLHFGTSYLEIRRHGCSLRKLMIASHCPATLNFSSKRWIQVAEIHALTQYMTEVADMPPCTCNRSVCDGRLWKGEHLHVCKNTCHHKLL